MIHKQLDNKFGSVTLEIPQINMDEVYTVVGELQMLMVNLQKSGGYKSKFEVYHINGELNHFHGGDFGDDEENEGDISSLDFSELENMEELLDALEGRGVPIPLKLRAAKSQPNVNFEAASEPTMFPAKEKKASKSKKKGK